MNLVKLSLSCSPRSVCTIDPYGIETRPRRALDVVMKTISDEEDLSLVARKVSILALLPPVQEVVAKKGYDRFRKGFKRLNF